MDDYEVFKTPKRQNLVRQRAKLVILRHPWITQTSWFYLNSQRFHFSGRKRSSASFGSRNWSWNQEVIGGWIQVFLVMYLMRAGRVLSRHSRDKPTKEPSKYFCYYKDLFLILLPIRLVQQQRQRLHRRRKLFIVYLFSFRNKWPVWGYRINISGLGLLFLWSLKHFT